MIIWEGEDFFGGVNGPAEDNLLRAPGGVDFLELVEGDWFLVCTVILVVGSEEFIDGAKEMSHHLPSLG